MNAIDRYFDRIFCINMDRSPERWAHVQQEATKHGITRIERFRGYDFHEWDHYEARLRIQMDSAMCGCSHSHSGIFHLIAHYGWDKTLILEDDFEILHDNFSERFQASIAQVPSDWDLVYLGGGYGTPPTKRISEHVVVADHIKTTSSYAIRAPYARLMAPMMAQKQGPDDLLSGFNPLTKAYILHPRLVGQYCCMSSIWRNVTHNTQSMTDPVHDKIVSALKF